MAVLSFLSNLLKHQEALSDSRTSILSLQVAIFPPSKIRPVEHVMVIFSPCCTGNSGSVITCLQAGLSVQQSVVLSFSVAGLDGMISRARFDMFLFWLDSMHEWKNRI